MNMKLIILKAVTASGIGLFYVHGTGISIDEKASSLDGSAIYKQ